MTVMGFGGGSPAQGGAAASLSDVLRGLRPPPQVIARGEGLRPLPRDVVEAPVDVAARLDRQEVYKRRLWEDRVPHVYAGAALAALRPQQDPVDGSSGRARGVSTYLDTGRPVLVAVGPNRRGKTWAAYAIGFAARARGMSAYAASSAELSEGLWAERHETREGTEERRTLLDTCHTVDILVIDDLLKEVSVGPKWANWLTKLYMILDWRLGRGLRTVLTSNPVGEDGVPVPRQDAGAALTSAYGEAIGRRMFEAAVTVWIDGDRVVPPAATWAPFGGGA